MRFYVSIIALFFTVFSCGETKESAQVKAQWERILKSDDAQKDVQSENSEQVSIPKSEEVNSSIKKDKPKENSFKKTGKTREDLMGFSKQFLGTPYVYASSDPNVGFDCSGFINYVFHHFGFEVPRSSKDFFNFGRDLHINEVQKGDLVIFNGTELDSPEIGHIGIVLNANGMNSDFIHSSSGKANGVTISSLSEPHYTKRFVKAISVID